VTVFSVEDGPGAERLKRTSKSLREAPLNARVMIVTDRVYSLLSEKIRVVPRRIPLAPTME
jgi:hypothetical protein